MAQVTPASTLENLSRLAAKPGVQSTLILSKSNGSIIRSTGLLATSSLPPQETHDNVGNGETHNGSRDFTATQGSSHLKDQDTKRNTAEDVARMVFSFVTAANAFAEGIDTADAVKLLRLRTRKHEIVIVPDPKFLLVVLHDTPPA